jgi:tetratricopeptide (TPR) repeat protein
MDYGMFAVLMGHTEQGVSAARRAVLLDPLNRATHIALVDVLFSAGQQEEAISVTQDALALDPTYFPYEWVPYYLLGNYQSAQKMCEANLQVLDAYMCLAVVYHKLARHADAERALEKFKTAAPDDWYHFAEGLRAVGRYRESARLLGSGATDTSRGAAVSEGRPCPRSNS